MMGWTSYHAKYYKNGKVDRQAECDAHWEKGLNAGHYQVVRSAMHGSVYYAAVRSLLQRVDDHFEPLPEEEQTVFGVVLLTKSQMRDYNNFSYKGMDETCDPAYYDCPARILKLLSPTDNPSALEWRSKCRIKHQSKNDPRSLDKLPAGTKIKFNLQCDSRAGKTGDAVICTKIKLSEHSIGIWYGVGFRWPKAAIPKDYEILG